MAPVVYFQVGGQANTGWVSRRGRRHGNKGKMVGTKIGPGRDAVSRESARYVTNLVRLVPAGSGETVALE